VSTFLSNLATIVLTGQKEEKKGQSDAPEISSPAVEISPQYMRPSAENAAPLTVEQ